MTNTEFSRGAGRNGDADWFVAGQGLERREALVCGFRMSYVTGGHGDPIVLLHGLGSESSTWRKILPTLAEHYTVYALDLFGCGRSDKPAIAYTIEAMAHYMRLFMDAVGIQQAHFIGHSYGGGIAMQTLYFSPDRLRRVVLLDSGGLGRDVHWLLRISTLPGAHRVIGMLSNPRSGVIPLVLRLEQRQQRIDAAYESELPIMLGRLRELDTRRSFLRMVRGIGNIAGQTVSALPHLPKRAETPLLLIWGEKDAIIPVAHGQVTAALLPRAHLEVIPDCYHQPHTECPQRVLDLTLNFLQAATWPPEAVAAPSVAEALPPLATAAPVNHVAHRALSWRWIASAAVALAGVPAGISLLVNSHGRRHTASPHPVS